MILHKNAWRNRLRNASDTHRPRSRQVILARDEIEGRVVLVTPDNATSRKKSPLNALGRRRRSAKRRARTSTITDRRQRHRRRRGSRMVNRRKLRQVLVKRSGRRRRRRRG